jgi:hypothetical protein
MADRPFQIYGDSVPKMVGRRQIMERLRRGLNKTTPDHMKIIGPRASGKTVVVEALLEELRKSDKPFAGVVRWDLGHTRAADDDDFLVHLRDQIAKALKHRQPYWSKTLTEDYADDARSGLKEVLGELAGDGVRVLVVLDGLEKTLASGQFTRNLWDNLADLGRMKSLRYLTVSQGKPHELIRDPDSAASDFWGLFDQGQLQVGCFDEEDITSAIAEFPRVEFKPGARTELVNWTLGFPPLLLSVLNEFAERGVAGQVDAPEVAAAADAIYDRVEETLARLWRELPETAKELQRSVAKDSEVAAQGRAIRDIDALVERGFAVRKADRILKPNRLLSRYLTSVEEGDGSLRRLFSSESEFILNSRTVLELRLRQIQHLDEELRHSIEKGLADLPDHPGNCLNNVRNVADRALDTVWRFESPTWTLPSEWVDTWRYKKSNAPNKWDWQFPIDRGQQVALLQLVTGHDSCPSVAKYVTRSAYFLVSAVHGFGNFGQHRGPNDVVHATTALAAMTVCVELAATLSRELVASSQS